MSDEPSVFSSPELKDTVQNMRDLLSQSRLAFLLGAGCSCAAGLPDMNELTGTILANLNQCKETNQLLTCVKSSFTNDDDTPANIEDYMSEIVDHLSIVQRRTYRGAANPKVAIGDHKWGETEIQGTLDKIKENICSILDRKNINIENHQQFVRAIHRSLESGKSRVRCVDYFVLNYDTLLEDALGIEKVPYSDGFVGGSTGWWDPDNFRKNGNAAHVFKLHGSIDWRLLENDNLPRRIRPGIKTEPENNHVMIYPAATKYMESQRDPFAQLLNHMRQSILPSTGEELVLAICGYSFGDSHINSEIESALYQSDGRLTIVAFVSEDKPSGILKHWIENSSIGKQIHVHAKYGHFHGSKALIVEKELSWWKFEDLAKLLEGER